MHLNPRSFVSEEPTTRGSTATIDPKEYVASILIAQIADGWLVHTQNVGNTATTIINRASFIRSLGKFLTASDDRYLTLETTSSDLQSRLLEWERHLIVEHGPESERSKKASNTIRQYVAAYLNKYSIDNSLVRRWVASRTLRYQDHVSQSTPLDEFSNEERVSIEQTFRKVVRSTERFQEIGNFLLLQGQDPRSEGWEDLANIVWALHHIPLDEIPKTIWTPDSSNYWWTILDEVVPETTKLRPMVFGHPLISLVIPHLLYLQAVQSLFLLRTGWTPEEVLHLKNTDIEFSDTGIRVATTKKRASTSRHRELSSPARNDTDWGWNPGDLLRRAAHTMQPVKTHSIGSSDFWVGALSRPYYRSRNVTLPAWLSTLPASPQFTFATLVKRTGLVVSTPADVRRPRKTHKSVKAILLGTLAGSAGDDHSIEVFRTHYAQSTTVHTIAAQTVLSAQQLVMNRIGPTVILESAAKTLTHHQDDQIGNAAKQTTRETPTDIELSVSSCTDPTNPPHTAEDQCFDAPRMCLSCANAVIFKDHVPRLVAYRQILKDLEPEMAPQQFSALYGQQITNIDAALNQFPEDLVNAAKTAPPPIRVPLTMRKAY